MLIIVGGSLGVQVRLDIQMAARDGDIAKALQVYDKAKADGLKITQDFYCTLLFLCSLGMWHMSAG